jgi:secreted trypsin-like serine protease
MNRITLLLLIVVLFSSITAFGQTQFSSYGDRIDQLGITNIDKLSAINESDTVSMKIKAKVNEVCQMKGCWMTLDGVNGVPVRVTFKDYGFFVPKDIAGREVIVNGIVSKTTLSEKDAKHYAEDAGEEYDPSRTYIEYAFVADGVLVSQE